MKQFCDSIGVKARDTFCIYEIMQCDKADAAYYEGHIYDLIEAYFPQITLINKNKPNRGKRESNKNWRDNNPERCKAHWLNWRDNNTEYDRVRSQKRLEKHPYYHKQWHEMHPNYRKHYNKEYYEKNKHRNKQNS